MKYRRRFVLASGLITCLIVGRTLGVITVHCEPILSSIVAPGEMFEIECFATSDTEEPLIAAQLDFDCNVSPRLGANGTISITSLEIDSSSHNGIQRLIPFTVTSGVDVSECVGFTQICGICPPEILPIGETRYFVTLELLVSECADGSFSLILENFSTPPVPSDDSGFLIVQNGVHLVQVAYEPLLLTVQSTNAACCLANGNCTAVDDPNCCLQQGGVPQGSGTVCDGDVDGDGVDAACGDVCLGFDDRIDDDNDGIPDCLQTIPTVSTWGLVILALLLLTGAKMSGSGGLKPAAR